MTQRFHLNHLFQPQKGMSLIEVAMAMGLISICVGLLLQVVGGNRVRMTQGGENFASHAQINSHQSHEYMVAASMANQVSNGDFTPFNNCNWSNGNPANLGPGRMSQTPQGTTCVDQTNSKPIFYRWQVMRSNNAVTGAHTANSVSGQNLPDANYPVENQLYQGRLLVYSDQNARNFMFGFPVSIFRNMQAPAPVQSNLIASVSMDTTGSMLMNHNGIPRMLYAKESLREFVNSMENNPYVSLNSRLSLYTFNTMMAGKVSNDIGFTYVTKVGDTKKLPGFEEKIECIMPNIDECQTRPHIMPNGQTNLVNPLSLGLNGITNQQAGYSNFPSPTNPLMSKSSYDRLFILVSDGNHTDPAVNRTTAENFIRNLANQNGFRNQNRNDRITIMTIGLLGSDAANNDNTNQAVLRQLTQATPYGLYIPTTNIDQLEDAFDNISNQFQFFSLKHKPERWGVYL
jgi:prepilin-type N-terminal cleavage/methylation domain-containing protein